MGQRFAIADGANSVKMRDGTVYYPSRRGTIEVESRRHAEEIKASSAHQEYDMINPSAWRDGDRSPSNMCPNCCFNAWDFTTRCPRCDTPLRRANN